MSRRPSSPPSRRNDGRVSRRKLLTGVALGVSGVSIAHAATNVDAFTRGSTDRGSTTTVGSDAEGVVGTLVSDTVQRNQQSLLTQLTNKSGTPLTVTVSLSDCTEGTLYGPNATTGCSVSFTLDVGQSRNVDLETGAGNGTTIPFTISGSSDTTSFSFSLPRETTAEAGNVTGSVTIDRIQQFRKRPVDNEWAIRWLTVTSDEHNLNRVEIRIRDLTTNDIVGERIIRNINSQQYDVRGQGNTPALRFSPIDSSYTVRDNRTYEVTVTAFDTEDNFGQETAED